MSNAQKIMAWLFIACSVLFALSQLAGNADARSDAGDPRVYRDAATGCEYLSTDHDGALTPRISANGKTHMGCKGTQP